jgi:ABC-type uncharacterized transport system permease subunit
MEAITTIEFILLTVISAATPLLLAATGELVAEKSGVLNLGIEGMMLAGAVCAFIAALTTGSWALGIVVGAAAGILMSMLFGLLTLIFLANQVASGLALTLFGIGLSSLIGIPFIGLPIDKLPTLDLPLLGDIPIFGPLLFEQDALVYISIIMALAVHWFLNHSKSGLVLRAVGESHDAAHSIGYSVLKIRFLAVMFGGAMAGLGGAFLSLSYTPMWVEHMTAGRGWIALALVVFATWKPGRVIIGAYLFGAVTILQLHLQGIGVQIPAQILSMLPYLVTILVLVLISRNAARVKLNAPACIGQIFHPNT